MDPKQLLNLAGGFGIATSVIGGAVGFFMGQSQKEKAERQARAAQAKLNSILSSRQSVINPYAGVTDLSGLATDLSTQMNNPYANLGVATQAAEMQMEQSDMALANTLEPEAFWDCLVWLAMSEVVSCSFSSSSPSP